MNIVRGVCPSCGRTITRTGRVPVVVVCDCYRRCPICGLEMTPYRPDLDPKTYGSEDHPDWDVLGLASGGEVPSIEIIFVCLEHAPPYYSRLKPVEVTLK
mgnify:CR=1 FL=1